MINYTKLSDKEINRRYFNMIQRCYDKKWQEKNGSSYAGVTVCDEWLHDKHNTYFPFIRENFYEVGDYQMDIDHNIIDPQNTVYCPDKVLIVPHFVNVAWANLEVGKNQIAFNPKTETYNVRVYDRGEIITTSCPTYNEALDAFCTIKQGLIYEMAESLKEEVPEKVYAAMINTDVRKINEHHYNMAA